MMPNPAAKRGSMKQGALEIDAGMCKTAAESTLLHKVSPIQPRGEDLRA